MALPIAVFELFASPYDRMTDHPAWRAHCASLAEHFPPPTAGRRTVLDLGCGPGVSALALARTHPDDAVIGLDLSAGMMTRARRSDPGGRCGWIRGDALALPFADASADAVTGHSFLYLLPDRRQALREIRRVLRPGGRLVLLEPVRQAALDAARSVRGILADHGPHLAFTLAAWRVAARTSGAFTEAALQSLVREAGLGTPTLRTTLHGMGFVVVAERGP